MPMSLQIGAADMDGVERAFVVMAMTSFVVLVVAVAMWIAA
jgi:hypothetical protein